MFGAAEKPHKLSVVAGGEFAMGTVRNSLEWKVVLQMMVAEQMERRIP